MSRAWTLGTMVRARQPAKLTARVDGRPKVGKWVYMKKGSTGRIVDVVKEKHRGIGRNVYLVQFASGTAEVGEAYLERMSGFSETSLSKEAMDVADPNLQVKEVSLESEPEY